MSRLIGMIRDYATKNGKADLCKAAGKSERQLLNYLNGTSNIPETVGYKLARQCGCNDAEALTLSREASAEAMKAG